MSYWFNLTTHAVETDENRTRDADILGPYDTYAEAAAALETVAENNERWDEEDDDWGDSAVGEALGGSS